MADHPAGGLSCDDVKCDIQEFPCKSEHPLFMFILFESRYQVRECCGRILLPCTDNFL